MYMEMLSPTFNVELGTVQKLALIAFAFAFFSKWIHFNLMDLFLSNNALLLEILVFYYSLGVLCNNILAPFTALILLFLPLSPCLSSHPSNPLIASSQLSFASFQSFLCSLPTLPLFLPNPPFVSSQLFVCSPFNPPFAPLSTLPLLPSQFDMKNREHM